MTLFLILLAIALVVGVAWTLTVTARDGYRRVPDRDSGRTSPSTWS
ncbi:hypothetical protein [Labedella phragmitis]|nr:hypothetical protein [Labedella phragmitis]